MFTLEASFSVLVCTGVQRVISDNDSSVVVWVAGALVDVVYHIRCHTVVALPTTIRAHCVGGGEYLMAAEDISCSHSFSQLFFSCCGGGDIVIFVVAGVAGVVATARVVLTIKHKYVLYVHVEHGRTIHQR